MRPRFEKDLRGYSDVAKEEAEFTAEAPEELDRLSVVLDWHLEKSAERQNTNADVQREIYDLQKKKQEVMSHLKVQLECLDNPECQLEKGEGERSAEFDAEQNGFKYLDDNGKEQVATLGDLITDMDWGVYYNLDADAPRSMAKKYLVERAKQELRELLDLQIIKSESGSSSVHEFKRETYKIIEDERASGVVERRVGFISEAIVKDFLKKLSIDNKDLPFEIHEADVFQDVEQKIDFIIHLKEGSRGVGVEESADAKDVGVQFSIAPEFRAKKQEQVNRSIERLRANREHIRDIALVIFPLAIAEVFKGRWIRHGRPAGGPEKFLYKDMAEKLFTELLKDIVAKEEITKAWELVKNNFPERGQ